MTTHSSSSRHSSSSSQSTAYITAAGAGGSSSSSATSPAGESSRRQASDFVAGAASVSASGSASASGQGVTTSAQVTIPAAGDDRPSSGTNHAAPAQNLFWGGDGADIFQLAATGVTELSRADIILDYNSASGDQLTLAKGVSTTDIA
ncbi:MAG: hypothetical protein AAF152_11210, partial [Cyanobacteria bacterium P01_A01_bin.114]